MRVNWNDICWAFLIFVVGTMFGYFWCWQALLGGK